MSSLKPDPKPEKRGPKPRVPLKRKKPFRKYTVNQIKRAVDKDSLPKLDAELWRLTSLLVRQLAANGQGMARCVTCGSWHHWRDMDAGHYMSRGCKATKFMLKNLGAQCTRCNILSSGRQADFGDYIDEKYGPGTAEQIRMMSKMACKRTKADYRYLIAETKLSLSKYGFVNK